MKKFLCFLGLSLAFNTAFGQVVFQEDWDGNGPGVDAWTIINVDGNTPSTGAAFVTDAWTRVDRGHNEYYVDLGGPAGDFCIVSTSFYEPDGASNDWLISPEITIPSDGQYYLIWDARTPGTGNYSDGYKLKLSPTAGNTINDFTVELLNVPAEEFEWNTRVISLANYQGQTIRLAWVNQSFDKSFVLIDNIFIQTEVPNSPDCVTPVYPENGATGIDFSSPINFTWEQATTGGTPNSYDFYISEFPNGTGLDEPMASGLSEKYFNNTLNGLKYNTTYYWKVIAKNSAGESSGCSLSSFTTQENPFAPYCGITYSQLIMPITNVMFAGIDNTSDENSNSSHEAFINVSGNVQQGSSYELKVQANTRGDYEFRFIAFFDWNQDGEFSGDNEVYPLTQTIQNSNGIDGITAVHTINVPENAVLGNTRMRIKSESINIGGTDAYYDPCQGMYGQAEDYAIAVSIINDIENVEDNAVSVYPNPTSDFILIHINMPQQDKVVVEIINNNGQKVKRISLDGAMDLTENISLKGYSKGVYTIRVIADGKEISRRVIVE